MSIVCRSRKAYTTIASAVEIAAPVGEQLKLGQLEVNFIVEKSVFTRLAGPLDGDMRVEVEFIQNSAGNRIWTPRSISDNSRANVKIRSSLIERQASVVVLLADNKGELHFASVKITEEL